MLRFGKGNYSDPAFFSYISGQKVPISYNLLQDFIKKAVAALGLNPVKYSSHSLRRGGASWAFHSRVPGELIQSHGDWTSLCYLRYLDFSLEERYEVSSKMTNAIQEQCK